MRNSLMNIYTRLFKFAIQRSNAVSHIREKSFNVFWHSLREKVDYDDAWMLALGMHHERIIDIGCNMGQSSLVFSYSGPKKMVMVDPQSIALSIAFKNMIDNDLARDVVFVCAFVSDKADQTIDFWSTAGGAAGSKFRTHSKSANAAKFKKKVVTTTVDEISSKYLPDAQLVKIDVEGAESEVLQGAHALAGKKEAKFFIEMHANQELTMHENARRVLDWCEAHDYHCWYLKHHQLLNSPEEIAHRGKCHLLLIPLQEAYPDYLRSIAQGAALNSISLK